VSVATPRIPDAIATKTGRRGESSESSSSGSRAVATRVRRWAPTATEKTSSAASKVVNPTPNDSITANAASPIPAPTPSATLDTTRIASRRARTARLAITTDTATSGTPRAEAIEASVWIAATRSSTVGAATIAAPPTIAAHRAVPFVRRPASSATFSRHMTRAYPAVLATTSVASTMNCALSITPACTEMFRSMATAKRLAASPVTKARSITPGA
jgi:hypothetical protein